MRLPNQAIPVVRGVRGSKPSTRVAISSYGSCVVSCLENTLGVTGLSSCADLTKLKNIESCVEAILQASTITTGQIISAAIKCGGGCLL